MLIPKIKRFTSLENVKKIRALPCQICMSPPPSDCHHLKSVGSGGGDDLANLVSLCRKHHNEFHQTGVVLWINKYQVQIKAVRRRWGLPPLLSRYID